MKGKYPIFLLFCLLPFLFLSCQPQQEFAYKVDNMDYNFGKVDSGTVVQINYTVKNTGKQTLVISGVHPDCGCTVAEDWDKEIKAGKTGKVPVSFKTEGYKGEVSKGITVTTNVPGKESLRLTFKGVVNNPVDIEPGSLHLGEVDGKTGALSGSYQITNNTGKPLKILEVVPPNDKTTYTLETIKAGEQYKLNFTVSPPFEGKEIVHFNFTVKTDSKKFPSITPYFSYYVTPPIQVYPINLMVSKEVENGEWIVYVRSHIDQPIRVLDAKINGTKEIQYNIREVEKDKFFQIEVKIPAKFEFKAGQNIFLTFKVKNDPQNILYNIPVQQYPPPTSTPTQN